MIDFHCDNCEFLQDKSNDNIIDGYCKKYNPSLTFYDWFEKCDKCLIETLQSENAELCERLSKAVELPCRVGDKVYCIHGMSNPELLEWQVNEIRITDHNYMLQLGRAGTKDYRSEASQFYGKWWFTELEAAEARLAELKGEKNE